MWYGKYGKLGQLAAEICWRVWGTPTNFNGFRVLALLLQRRRLMEARRKLNSRTSKAAAADFGTHASTLWTMWAA